MSNEMALMTVEITVSDTDEPGFALGGRQSVADAMQVALAELLGVEQPAPGKLLRLTLTKDEVPAVLQWIREHFPECGALSLSRKKKPLMAAPACASASPSEWRMFELFVHPDIPDDDELVPKVACVVDILHEQVQTWLLDPQKDIGAIIENSNPTQRVTVSPRERAVYVDCVSDEKKRRLRPLEPTPYRSIQ